VKILTLSNLYPRPDRPAFGMFNGQLFGQMATAQGVALSNVCLVPEWRLWRWRRIRGWSAPQGSVSGTRYQPVFYLPVIGRRWSARLYGWWNAALKHEIQKADVVYASWLFPDGVTAARLAETANVKVWIMVLGSDTYHLRNANRRGQVLAVDARVAGYVCVCQTVAQRLADVGIASERIHVVPNGVDPTRFYYVDPDQARDHLDKTLEPRLRAAIVDGISVLFVGNLVMEKGPDLCLEAFIAAAGSDDKRRLVFMGQGPMRGALARRAHDAGLSEHVHFVGSRPHIEIVHWMALADVLCLSSRTEGMPNVILEALACGCPVIASDVGACGEMLNDEPAGQVVPPGDVSALRDAMVNAFDTKTDRLALSTRHGIYTWNDQADTIVRLLGKEFDCD
jgi:glycosyltransferase involved in cell wall biosynthesis